MIRKILLMIFVLPCLDATDTKDSKFKTVCFYVALKSQDLIYYEPNPIQLSDEEIRNLMHDNGTDLSYIQKIEIEKKIEVAKKIKCAESRYRKETYQHEYVLSKKIDMYKDSLYRKIGW